MISVLRVSWWCLVEKGLTTSENSWHHAKRGLSRNTEGKPQES